MRQLVIPALAVVVAVVIWRSTSEEPSPDAIPACTWRVGTGTDTRQGQNYDEVAPETPVRLSFSCGEARYLYVFSHSAEDGTLLLWPSPLLQCDLAQPLPAGHSVLPGSLEGRELAWTTRSGIHGVTTYVTVASREKVAELEALAPRLRLWSNTVFPDKAMLVTKPSNSADVAGPPYSAPPAAVLERAVACTASETLANGPLHADPAQPGVWFGTWKVVEKKPR